MASASGQSDMTHGCIVMASGLGKRFGGNKLMAPLAGRPLVGHAIDAADGLFARCVVVTRSAEVVRYCEQRGAAVVLHDDSGRNDTVRHGMDALGECDAVTFLQGDQPLISANTLDRLLRAAEDDSNAIWRVSHGGMVGSPVLFPPWAFDELRALPEGKGGGFIAKKYPERVRLLPVRDNLELMDVDTQEDLLFLQGVFGR